MIKLQIIGNIGNDAVIRETENGTKAISFSVAKNDSYKDAAGTKIERSIWVKCTIWKNNNESTKIAEYLKKGTKVYVEGKPHATGYMLDGSTIVKANLELTVYNVELLTAGKAEPSAAPSTTNNGSDADDLPF